jgi:hypothetical protein
VLFVLICYCGLGGLLFRMWEGWPYFDAFYFCFITMATVGGLVGSKKIFKNILKHYFLNSKL